MQHVSDGDLKALLQLCEGLEFRTDLVPRQPNDYQTINAEQNQMLRAVMSDYAEFIVPVFWSHTELVGLTDVGDVSSLDLLRRGHQEIVNAGLIEGESAPRPFWAKSDYMPYEEWAYARNSLCGFSSQANAPGVRRQGYLVVGRQKVSVLGLHSDWEPSFDQVPTRGVSPKFLRDPHFQYQNLAHLLPPEDLQMEVFVVKEFDYGEIETIRPIELVRIDGLAALLAVASKVYSESEWYKPTPRRSIAKLLELPSLVSSEELQEIIEIEFSTACQNIEHGPNVASGTGNDPLEETPNKYLFNSALGLAIESSVDGTKIFVEAPFSEIDTALELITHQINSARQESNNSAKQVAPASEKLDLAGELAKLASLHQSGILSDEEFAAAKTAVIGAAGR